jgi:hypothetical protein
MVKYGDTVTLKLCTRNYIDKPPLTFMLREDVFGFDKKLNETVSIPIDAEGNGEAPFTVPEGWKDLGDPCQVRKYYFEEKETGIEFPRAYYVANPNKTEEENKSNSQRIEALMLKVTDDETLDDAQETESAAILGEEWKPEENNGEACDPLSWGKKLSCDERRKVIEIAERLEADPNIFMCAMALETGGKFDASIQNKKTKATGLIQFMPDTAKGLNTSVQELKEMSILDQLDYVEKHLKPKKGKLNTLVDFYLAILFPVDCGKGGESNHVVFDKDLKLSYKSNGEVIKNTTYYRKYGYAANPTFHKEKPESGKTYIWEIIKEIERWELQGKGFANKCKKDISTCKYGSKKGASKNACSDCGQVHLDLSIESNWETQPPGECYATCVKILKKYGVTPKDWTHQILTANQSGNNITKFNAKEGINYIDSQLEKGNPVIVGLDRSFFKATYNNHKATDHFVLIVGRLCSDGKIQYHFHEVGTEDKDKGISANNIFNLENDLLKGSPAYNSSHKYTVTEVRRNN